MTQAVDREGAADYLGVSPQTVARRIKSTTSKVPFPPPDEISSLDGKEVEWWNLSTLDKYKRALTRKSKKKG